MSYLHVTSYSSYPPITFFIPLRSSKARTLLKLTLSLHKRLAKHTLLSIPPSPTQHHTLDTFLIHSSSLTASIDDLVSSLHPPHQLLQNGRPLVSEYAQELSKTITTLKSLTLSSHSSTPINDDPIPAQKLAQLNLSDSTPSQPQPISHPHPITNTSSSSSSPIHNPPPKNQHTSETTH